MVFEQFHDNGIDNVHIKVDKLCIKLKKYAKSFKNVTSLKTVGTYLAFFC